MLTLSKNSFGVSPGEKGFDLHSNICDYFEIGLQNGEDVWLQGQIVEGEFVFNGRIFLRGGSSGTIIDNFPRAELPDGWTKKPNLSSDGYQLEDENGETVFGYEVIGNTCNVQLNLHDANGELAAHGGQGGLVSHVPALIGRGGIRYQ
jgi:hypothetical protein